jgi:hypothetical protein
MTVTKSNRKNAPSELAAEMLRVLQSQRELGEDQYPLTIRELARHTGDSPAEKLIHLALRTGLFKAGAIAARQNDLDSPVAFQEDVERLAASPLTLQFALDQVSGKVRAVTVAFLKKKLTSRNGFDKRFQNAVTRMLEAEQLPPNVGWVYAGRNPSLFRIADLHPAKWRESLQPPCAKSPITTPNGAVNAASTGDFAKRFDDAFAQLDRRQGNFNLVKLLDLRDALGDTPREQFDKELRQLRVAGRYGLSGAESRWGISQAEREAGIHEAGSLLMLVSRRT